LPSCLLGYLILQGNEVSGLAHILAAGVVIIMNDMVLLVKDKYGWGLPKGSTEEGETFLQTAAREVYEETGYNIAFGDAAFITEYTSKKYGQYLQVYYSGELLPGGVDIPIDPDQDVLEVKFVAVHELRSYVSFRPWVLPLEYWFRERLLKYHSFDLDIEGFDV